MRSGSDLPRGGAHLVILDRDRWGLPALVALGFLVITITTGAASSPFVPLLAVGITITSVRFDVRTAMWAGCVCAALLLLLDLAFWNATLREVLLVAAVVVAGAVPAMFIARAKQKDRAKLDRLTRILAEADRGVRGDETDATRRLDDLAAALLESCAALHAHRAVLWEVRSEPPVARARVVTDPRVVVDSVPLDGHPLGWVWKEGTPLRLEGDRWGQPGEVVHAARLDGYRDTLVTWERAPATPEPPPSAIAAAVAQLARAVSLADARVRANTERERSTLLLETLRRLPSHIEPHDFARELVSAVAGMTTATGCALATWHGEEGVVLAVTGDDGGPDTGARFAPRASEFALAARGGSTLVRERKKPGSALPIVAPGERWARLPRALVAIPLVTEHEAVGVLGFWSSTADQFDHTTIALVEALAPYAAMQLGHALEYGRAQRSAETDALTGLVNRRAFERILRRETSRFERYAQPLGLVAIDIDHFKQINDRFGHEAGDHVLRAVAETLRHEVRDVDLPVRLGGEEFVVLLPATVLPAINDAAERLRAAVERLSLAWRGSEIPVRISAGTSACPTCVAHPDDLLRSADAALYDAKHSGRNRVAAAPPRRGVKA